MTSTVTSTSISSAMTLGSARTVNLSTSAYRLVRESDGTLVLQGAHQWMQGLSGGVEWQDVPIIDRPKEGS